MALTISTSSKRQPITIMKKQISFIAITSGLLLLAACNDNKTASITNTSLSPAEAIKMAEGNGHDGHGGMTMPNIPADSGAESATATLTASNIQAGAETKLIIDVKAKSGEAVDKFETFQTKLMHLIVVSDDLQTFSHIHPIYKQKGRFEVQANFPQGGKYTLVSDYKPVGQAEQVSIMQVKVAEKVAATPKVNFTKAKLISDTKVQLTADNLKAGKETMIAFKMQETNGQAVTDLQPYLGEKGHLVIMKNSASLTRADYIHAHAVQHGDSGEVHFMTTFPKAGKYKMWGQFNRSGKIVTADFWVNVS
jgi:hypothetical protein